MYREADAEPHVRQTCRSGAAHNFQPTREQRLAGISDIVGREITSSNEMTRAEVQRVIDVTTAEIEETRPAEGDSNAGA